MDRMDQRTSISRPPTLWERRSNTSFRRLTVLFAWLTIALVLYIFFEVGRAAQPALADQGLRFLVETTWDPNANDGAGRFGIFPQIWGTLYSSILALMLGSFFGISVAIFLSEGYLADFVFRLLKLFGVQFHPFWVNVPQRAEELLKNTVELLAAIPSVVYGLWGIFVVIPLIRPGCNWVHEHLGWIPIFGTTLSGPGMLPAALVLAIMILPTVSAISRDALVSVPSRLREASYGLGATRWETIFAVILPTAASGIFGSIILAFGRALGETMALAMLVGNANQVSLSLFSPANTLAALLANSFPERDEKTEPFLMYAALVLMVTTLLVNVLGAWIVERATGHAKQNR